MERTRITNEQVDMLAGMSESEGYDLADANGWSARTLIRDGQGLMKLNDVRSDRINFYVENDVIVRASVG